MEIEELQKHNNIQKKIKNWKKNTKSEKASQEDTKLLKVLMILATAGMETDNKFNPSLLIGDNQEEFLKKFETKYEKKPIEKKRRMISKLISYLKLYNNIMPDDYKRYQNYFKELKDKPDKVILEKEKDRIEKCEKLLKSNRGSTNVRFYACIIKNSIKIDPIDLVNLTIEKSENYIDYEKKEIIINHQKKKGGSIKKTIKIEEKALLELLNIIFYKKTPKEIKNLLTTEKDLIEELKKQRKKYLIETLEKEPLTNAELSNELSNEFKKVPFV